MTGNPILSCYPFLFRVTPEPIVPEAHPNSLNPPTSCLVKIFSEQQTHFQLIRFIADGLSKFYLPEVLSSKFSMFTGSCLRPWIMSSLNPEVLGKNNKCTESWVVFTRCKFHRLTNFATFITCDNYLHQINIRWQSISNTNSLLAVVITGISANCLSWSDG